MSASPWNCPIPAAQYRAAHQISEQDFISRQPVYLTQHNAALVNSLVAPVLDCSLLIGVNPAGNLVITMAPGLVYYPAGLFKAILAANAESFEMFATNEAGPTHRPDVVMKIVQSGSPPAYYNMSKEGKVF